VALLEPILAIRELVVRGRASQNVILGLLITVIGVTCLVVLIERARRRFKINFAKREAVGRIYENPTSGLPVKLNPAGIIPILLASWLLSILVTIVYLIADVAPHLVTPTAVQMIIGKPLHLVLYASLIFFCTFFYAAYLLDPKQLAERLREQGGTIASIDPGQSAAVHFDYVLSRITFMGAAYLTLICLLPEIIIWYAQIPIYFGGQLLLILVCTALDIEVQLRGGIARNRRR
jgi:preprotein translocase subunit SecY